MANLAAVQNALHGAQSALNDAATFITELGAVDLSAPENLPDVLNRLRAAMNFATVIQMNLADARAELVKIGGK